MTSSIVYKVTFPDGESTYFGAQASAIACARSTGTVTEVTIHETQNNVATKIKPAMANSEIDALREALKMCEEVIRSMHIHNELDIPLANNALKEIKKLTHEPPTSAYKQAGDLVRCPIRGWISNKLL